MIHGIDTDFLIACEVEEHEHHAQANRFFSQCLERQDHFALTPMILAEFLHIATDAKRFAKPLSMEKALDIADLWWNAPESMQMQTGAEAVLLFGTWMRRHRLGRKRILDTLLAATLHHGGVFSLLTLNRGDFELFGLFQFPFRPRTLPKENG